MQLNFNIGISHDGKSTGGLATYLFTHSRDGLMLECQQMIFHKSHPIQRIFIN